MPNTLVKSWAKKYNMSCEKMEKLWARAKAIAAKKYKGKAMYKVMVGSILPNLIKGSKKEDIEYLKLYTKSEDAQRDGAIHIIEFTEEIFVGIFTSHVSESKPLQLDITTIAEEIDFLPWDESLKKKCVEHLESKFNGFIIVKDVDEEQHTNPDVAEAYWNPDPSKEQPKVTKEHPDYFTVISGTDIEEVKLKFRALAAASLFEEIQNLNLSEQYSFSQGHEYFPYGQLGYEASVFYQGIQDEYYSPVVEAFVVTALKAVINEYRILQPEELNEYNDIVWSNHSQLLKTLAVKMEGITIPDWYFRQLDATFNRPFTQERPYEAYDTKVAKLSNLCQKYPKEFNKLIEYYSPDDEATLINYIKTKPGHKRNSKKAVEFLHNVGLISGHLALETLLFTEKVLGRIAVASAVKDTPDIDISNKE